MNSRRCVVRLIAGEESGADPLKPSKIFSAESVIAPELGETVA